MAETLVSESRKKKKNTVEQSEIMELPVDLFTLGKYNYHKQANSKIYNYKDNNVQDNKIDS